ncbi:hypothetical protein [Variovorax sp. GB1P17]|uniref:hypothetical protein n=1 Tax=Variovorax sp. GB1P17 TaxID=3443740 RepID=UPI003F4533CA
MTPAKLWLSIFLTAFAVFTGLLIQTLLTTAAYGDLARIGRISDYDFGWRIEPPQVDADLLEGVPIDKADILVIGDSFSATSRWQSQLTKAGYAVTTTFWVKEHEALCDDFDDWVAKAGFRGKLVVIESVERLLAWRLTNTQKCRTMPHTLESQPGPLSPPPEHVPGFALNWDGQLISGWLTSRCTRAAIAGKKRSECNQEALAFPVENGCQLFSHRRCDMALFLAGDKGMGELTPKDVAQMQAFTKSQSKVPILWMVVPNKWTTYLDPAHSQAFVTALKQTDLGPDLFSFTQEEKVKMKDFYFPNDTHISMHGQLLLGDRMLQAVRQKLGAAPAPSGD